MPLQLVLGPQFVNSVKARTHHVLGSSNTPPRWLLCLYITGGNSFLLQKSLMTGLHEASLCTVSLLLLDALKSGQQNVVSLVPHMCNTKRTLCCGPLPQDFWGKNTARAKTLLETPRVCFNPGNLGSPNDPRFNVPSRGGSETLGGNCDRVRRGLSYATAFRILGPLKDMCPTV